MTVGTSHACTPIRGVQSPRRENVKTGMNGLEASLEADVVVIEDATPHPHHPDLEASLSPSLVGARIHSGATDAEQEEARFGPVFESRLGNDRGGPATSEDRNGGVLDLSESDGGPSLSRRSLSRRWEKRLALLGVGTHHRADSTSHAAPAWAVPKFAERGLHMLTGQAVGKELQISKRTNEFALILAKGADVNAIHKALREEQGKRQPPL